MITRRGWRSSPVVNIDRQTNDIDPMDIAANMERHLQERLDKTAVQPSNLYEQITSIINGIKPKFQSVEAAVDDMKERSGFTSYHKEQNNFSKMKQAQDQSKSDNTPKAFKLNPQIKETVDNYITDTRGKMSVPAVLDRVKAIHKHDIDDEEWNDDALLKYVDQKCHDIKETNPEQDIQGLGKLTNFNDTSDVDPSNRDAFHSLSPAKMSGLQQNILGVKTASVKENSLLIALAEFDAPKDVKCDELTWLEPEDRDELKGWGTAQEVEGNPPAWVASEKTWDRAKKAVKKYWKKYKEPYGVIASVYESMGGKIKKKKK